MTKFAVALAGLMLPTLANAATLLTLGQPAKQLANINVAATATATVGGQAVNLTALGAGIRTDKLAVFLPSFNVYVGELFSDAPQAFAKGRTGDAEIQSLQSAQNVAFMMTFVYFPAAPGGQVVEAYTTGFSDNHVTMTPALNALMNAVQASGDIAQNDVIEILLHKNADGSYQLTYSDQNQASPVVINGDSTLLTSVMDLWFGGGNTDDGVKNLSNSVLQGM